MSKETLDEYIPRVRRRYSRMTGKTGRSRVLDKFCAVTGYCRKHAIKVLRGQKRSGKGPGRGGAPRLYGPEEIALLKYCWQRMEQPCGKRMVGMLPLWLPHLPADGERPPATRARVLKMSPATIDRLLAPAKVGIRRKRLVPRSDAAIKALIEIRAQRWDTQEVGWTEVDTVAHCGGDMGGSFIWSLTSVEILSGWTEIRCLWNRGQHATLAGLEEIGRAQPFALRGIDSDGGGEFINYHLYHHLKNQGIHQTRSRPYRKNDQAHVEQKNYTHVRQIIGYERLGHQELIDPLNELMREWSLWKNLFCTTMEQLSSTREGSRQKRKHVKAVQTPAQRLLATDQLTATDRQGIETSLAEQNPFAMKARIELLLGKVWQQRKALISEDEEGIALGTGSSLRSEPVPRAIKQPTKPPKANRPTVSTL
ncbi:MAG: transposase family protein [Verrucomicrobiota bacterium]|nr:transposase family protein [Verrucomicrobiota bacterium]